MWGKKQQKAFTQLQWCLPKAPVLALPDLAAPYEVVGDASGICCINAVEFDRGGAGNVAVCLGYDIAVA